MPARLRDDAKPDVCRIAREVRSFEGVLRKNALRDIVGTLGLTGVSGSGLECPGDDAAALWDGERYLLLAADGLHERLVARDPYRAGRAAVLVNVNDIYAMGGRPLALVNVIGMPGCPERDALLRGMRAECDRLRVPMVGGHYLPEPGGCSVAAAILGEAKTLLSGRAARPGQFLVLAVDLDGEEWGAGFDNWDSHCRKDPDRVVGDLEILPALAEEGIATAARDLSNAGILGSIGTLLELSRVGAVVDVDAIARPENVGLMSWLRTFPSFGFVIACDEAMVRECVERFEARSIWAAPVGEVTAEQKILIRYRGAQEILFDFRQDAITGL